MTLQQLLQSYDFEEIFPEVGLMYPHARRKRKEFATAYMLLREMKPQVTKRQIRYQLMQDPNTNEMFFGADDACFAEKWAVLIGKEVKRDAGVDLTDTQMLANCLLNCVLILQRLSRPISRLFDKRLSSRGKRSFTPLCTKKPECTQHSGSVMQVDEPRIKKN